MKTLVVVGHPCMKKSVVNKAWVHVLRPHEGDHLWVHILEDALQKDGTFDLKAEHALISRFDRIVLQFPLYWYMPPAIMKLWMDTVWCEGWAWGEGGEAMKGKLIEAAVSCGAPEGAFSQTSLDTYLQFVQGSANFVQAKGGGFFAYYGAELPNHEEFLKDNCEEYLKFITGRS